MNTARYLILAAACVFGYGVIGFAAREVWDRAKGKRRG